MSGTATLSFTNDYGKTVYVNAAMICAVILLDDKNAEVVFSGGTTIKVTGAVQNLASHIDEFYVARRD